MTPGLKKIASAGLSTFFSCLLINNALAAPAATVQGAGSSAAAPIYQNWAEAYKGATGNLLDYQPVGSSSGLKRIREQSTHFGASDFVPAVADLDRDGLLIFPVAITGISPVVNLPKFKGANLRLSGEVLARIFLGDINQWSHADIARLNPEAALPNLPITVVVRSDGSGTTYNFADYLSKVSPQWKTQYGVKASFDWPKTNSYLPAKGSSAVVKAVKVTLGAIGYVDYSYAADSGLVLPHMKNKEGVFVSASIKSVRSAVTNSEWAHKASFAGTLTDQAGRETWPITMGTFVLAPKVAKQTDETLQAMRFFIWSFMNGDVLVQRSNFVRLPDEIQASVFKMISSIQDSTGKPLGNRVIKGFY